MNSGSHIGVLAESSPALGSRYEKALHDASLQWSAYVHHVETEEASDLGDATGVMADTQRAVMRRTVAAPAVDELGWR
jgi:hypothetical protein